MPMGGVTSKPENRAHLLSLPPESHVLFGAMVFAKLLLDISVCLSQC